jgi:tight adherence protein B
MLLPLLTFVVVMVTMMGVYWAFVVRLEDRERTALAGRLTGMQTKVAKSTVVASAREASAGLLERLAVRSRAAARLEQWLVESDVGWSVAQYIGITVIAGLLGVLLGWIWVRLVVAAALFGLVGFVAPTVYVSMTRAKRLRLFEEQFPEAIDLISRALRAGHSFTTGLGLVADEIPAPVGKEFQRVYDEQNFGIALPEALRQMGQRIPLIDARFFATAVITQRESGGNLAEVLDNLASVIRERFKVKRQIRVISAHGRISAWVLALWPPALALAMSVLAPDVINKLVTDPMGRMMALIAIALQVMGTIIIAKMVKIEY